MSDENTVRLNKYLADCGIVSRRGADELIADGKVIINGKRVFELGIKVNPSEDRITVSGKPVKPTQNKVYILFNKPRNVVTTMNDPEGRPTIGDFFNRLPVRVFPVGRLDWDTEGMILLTNDGDFAQKVNHPSQEVYKTYLVKVNGKPTQEQLNKLMRGVSIIGGRVQAKGVERIRRGADKYDWIKIMISEGKNRQIRHMFEKIGFDVIKLQRVAIGRLKMGNLKRGEYVFLTEKGLSKIFQTEPLGSDGKPLPKEPRLSSNKRLPQAQLHRETADGEPVRVSSKPAGRADSRAEGRSGGRADGRPGSRPGRNEDRRDFADRRHGDRRGGPRRHQETKRR